MRNSGITIAIILAEILAFGLLAANADDDTSAVARGVVYHDRNANGSRDDGEEGLADVRVSNGRDIVTTDADGRYELDVTDDTIVFVLKPGGWRTAHSNEGLPRFYYIHKPGGSPKLEYPGVPPTGSLPDAINFPLVPQEEPNKFRALIFGDPQPTDLVEIDYFAHDVIEEVVGTDAKFGVVLGDLVNDNLALFEPLTRTLGVVDIPWYCVIGNHDMNYDSPDDVHSDETYERVFGPSYYAFDYGPVHFVVLDDVFWSRPNPNERGRYHAELGEKQFEFLRNDLAGVSRDRLVVLTMHIPLGELKEREALFEILDKFPHSVSLSAHYHYQQHVFFSSEHGWHGSEPHHHVINVTPNGSWWTGAPDETGLPHTTMRDGAPNGYSYMTFDGHRYSLEFKAARRPADHQMTIYAPEQILVRESPRTEVLVNVFAGSERSRVEMRLGESGEWIPLERVEREDPYYAKLKDAEKESIPPRGERLPNIIKSPHLWSGKLPAEVTPGSHLIRVRTTDMFGQTYEDERVIRVLE